MFRFLAHKVVVDDVCYGLSTVTISDCGIVDIVPFTDEMHSTHFIDGTVIVKASSGDKPLIFVDGKPLNYDL